MTNSLPLGPALELARRASNYTTPDSHRANLHRVERGGGDNVYAANLLRMLDAYGATLTITTCKGDTIRISGLAKSERKQEPAS
jgi:hypothetical protein